MITTVDNAMRFTWLVVDCSYIKLERANAKASHYLGVHHLK